SGVEDAEQVGNAGAEIARRVTHDPVGDGVALLRRIVDGLGRHALELPADETGKQRRRLLAHADLPRARRDRRSGGVRLETPVIPAFAVAAVQIDRRVADLALNV